MQAERLPTPKARKALVNVLPSRYKTWLNFYDAIPAQYQNEKSFRSIQEVSRDEFLKSYPDMAADAPFLAVFHIAYHIDREWMLARIAEELLPSRMYKGDINTLEGALHQAGKYDSSAIFMKGVELLTPLWQVSRDER